MINYFWGAVLILHPYLIKISQFVDHRQGVDFAFSCFVVISTLLWGVKPDKKALIFCGAILINLAFQKDFNLYYALSQNYLFLTGILFVFHINTHIKQLEKTFHISVVISSILACIYWFMGDILAIDPRALIVEAFYDGVKVVGTHGYNVSDGMSGGFLLNPNASGAYLALSIPSYFKLNLKKFSIIPALFLIPTSAWPMVTALAFYAFYLWDLKKLPKIVPYIASIVLLIGAYFLTDHSKLWHDSGRFASWEGALEMFSNGNILWGNGLGWFADNYSRFYKPFNLIMRQEHNEFLSALFAFGLIGFCSFILIFWHLSKATCSITKAAIFMIFINCLCNFPLHMTPIFAVIGFWAAIANKEAVND